MGIKTRIAMERAIVVALLEDAFAAGLLASIDNEGDGYIVVNNKDVDECMDVIFDLDECMIAFDTRDRQDVDDGTCRFWVNLVRGNDGWDIMVDHSLPEDPGDQDNVIDILKRASDLSDAFSNGDLDELLGYADLGRKILHAQGIKELSGVIKDGVFTGYDIDNAGAAARVTKDVHEAVLIEWLNDMLWNDIQIWSHHVQGKDYVTEHGRMTPDGKFYNADGTLWVDDPVIPL